MSSPKKQNELVKMVLEVLGFEHGFLATIIGLYKSPDKVVSSYLKSEHTFLSPYKLIIIVLGSWAILNSFLLDWEQVLKSIYPYSYKEDSMMAYCINVLVIFLEKLLVPFYLLLILLSSLILKRTVAKSELNFNHHFVILTYNTSMTSIPLVLVSFSLLVNNWLALAVTIIAALTQLSGKRNILNPSPLKNYLSADNKRFEIKYIQSIAIASISLIIICYVIFITYYDTFLR